METKRAVILMMFIAAKYIQKKEGDFLILGGYKH